MPLNIRVSHNLRIPRAQLEEDFGTSSGHIGNNLETSWGLLRDNLGLLGTTQDLVAGDYMGITCRISWGQLWDYFGTHRSQLGDFSGTTWDYLGSYWGIHGTYLWNILGATWGQLDDTLDYFGLTFGPLGDRRDRDNNKAYKITFISTEGALRLPATYDNQPAQTHPIHPHIAVKRTSPSKI